MSPIEEYLSRCSKIFATVEDQIQAMETAAEWFADSIFDGHLVHLFGAGHSRIMVEEMWPRYGSFPGYNPIVELSLTFHNLVSGANGQRQAMFLENQPGLAERILRNFDLRSGDSALVISSSGCNVVPIEMAQLFQAAGVRVVGLISKEHSEASSSNHSSGKKLADFSDLVLDTGAPAGDAMVRIPDLETPVSPGSTVGGAMIVNCIKAEVASRLTRRGMPPKVLTAGCIIGKEKAKAMFEAAYDEHAHRMARLFQNVGCSKTTRSGDVT